MKLIAGHDLVSIKSGSFLMGENENDKFANDTERPRHSVNLPSFRIGRAAITIGEYRLFKPGHEANLPADWPATMLTWQDTIDYCAWLGPQYRLPSEAEWEFAARAGSQQPYHSGDTLSVSQANYYYDEQGNKVGPGHRTPAGSYPANAFGIYDMLGNTCEWVQDSWNPMYHNTPNDGQAAERTKPTSIDLRVIRGGAWDYLPRLLRSSWRDAFPANKRRDNIGFRIATDL